MRGAQMFMATLRSHGVEAMFGNPGTTENSLLDRLADHPEIEYIVALHEGVAVSAASFHAQATGRASVVNLHVAPGLGNAIGSIYGALKADSPMVVTAGQQDTRMRLRNPLLGHDLVAMAAPVTKWSAQPTSADEIGPMLARAFEIAMHPPSGPVFMALPVDVMEQETTLPVPGASAASAHAQVDVRAVEEVVAAFARSHAPALVVGDDVARSGAAQTVVTLAERTGAAVYVEAMRAQAAFPNRHPNFRGRLPFEGAAIRSALEPYDLVFLAGGPFFEEVWYDPGSSVPETATILQLEASDTRLGFNLDCDVGVLGAVDATLAAIVEALPVDGAAAGRNALLADSRAAEQSAAHERLQRQSDSSPMSPARAIDAIARAAPDDVVVVDESITASLEVGAAFDLRGPGDYYGGRGGGIGQGIAGAIGVQVAHPDRPVLAISGDGSAMYSITALWTAAHHNLPIVFVILSNGEYRVLKHNLDIFRQRFEAGGGAGENLPYPHMDLGNPQLGFVDMARGMGVAAERVDDPERIGDVLAQAFQSNGPYLVDIAVSGKR